MLPQYEIPGSQTIGKGPHHLHKRAAVFKGRFDTFWFVIGNFIVENKITFCPAYGQVHAGETKPVEIL
ncbi:hypothetical protein ACOJBM_31945 [Rhizobium beringeri]